VKKYSRAGQAKNDNMAPAECKLEALSLKHILKIYIVFPLQQWLHEHASILHFTYIASLVRPKPC